jgi:hypothetical protein
MRCHKRGLSVGGGCALLLTHHATQLTPPTLCCEGAVMTAHCGALCGPLRVVTYTLSTAANPATHTRSVDEIIHYVRRWLWVGGYAVAVGACCACVVQRRMAACSSSGVAYIAENGDDCDGAGGRRPLRDLTRRAEGTKPTVPNTSSTRRDSSAVALSASWERETQ